MPKDRPKSGTLRLGLDPPTLARIDAVAWQTGVSRNVLLRELLGQYADEQVSADLSHDEVALSGSSVSDLLDADRRADAWRR